MENRLQSSDAILEFSNISDNNVYSVVKIDKWLDKYAYVYDQANTIVYPKTKYSHFLEKNSLAFEFIEFYEFLKNISLCEKNELFFKEQLSLYDKVKNNVTELKNWFYVQKQDVNKKHYLFNDTFYDNRELTDYRFKISNSLILDCLEFKYSLEFSKLLMKATMIEIIGEVIQINEVETFEKKKKINSTSPKYTRQKMLIDTKDVHHNIFQITFVNGKTALLTNISLGQKVKIFTDLRGGYIQKEIEKEYYSNLLGWDLEILEK